MDPLKPAIDPAAGLIEVRHYRASQLGADLLRGAARRDRVLRRGARLLTADRRRQPARHGAHRTLLQRGFRPILNGLTMLRPHERAYNRPDAYVIDDLR
jgi:hypothetical protein